MTTTRTAILFTLFAACLLTVGCGGQAWQMRRGAWSGELALHGSITTAEYAAQDQMLAHCGGRFRIVEGAEAERVAIADASTHPARELSVDRTGRRVHYVCVSRAPDAFRRPVDGVGAVTVSTGAHGGL